MPDKTIPWDDETRQVLLEALRFIIDGHYFEIHDDRWIVIDTGEQEDGYYTRKVVVDTHSLAENGNLTDPTESDREKDDF